MATCDSNSVTPKIHGDCIVDGGFVQAGVM